MNRSPEPPATKRTRWRPSGSTVFIAVGVIAYLFLRQLPPDNSRARVKAAGILTACVPPSLAPFVSSDGSTATGSEARLLTQAAGRLGVPVAWNVQAAWGTSPDPVDWGVRPESCDVLAGGIVVNEETQGMMQVLPYRRTGWALLTTGREPVRLAVLTNHWGLSADQAYDWADARHLDFEAASSAQEALTALKGGQRDSVLGLQEEVAWIHGQVPGSHVSVVSALPLQTLALGMWKNNITLKRVLKQTIFLER